MTDEPEGKDIHRFGFTYALDRDGFFRRACPSCGREYKVKAAPEDLAYSLQLAFREIGLEIGEARDESEQPENGKSVYCPYCGLSIAARCIPPMIALVYTTDTSWTGLQKRVRVSLRDECGGRLAMSARQHLSCGWVADLLSAAALAIAGPADD